MVHRQRLVAGPANRLFAKGPPTEGGLFAQFAAVFQRHELTAMRQRDRIVESAPADAFRTVQHFCQPRPT